MLVPGLLDSLALKKRISIGLEVRGHLAAPHEEDDEAPGWYLNSPQTLLGEGMHDPEIDISGYLDSPYQR